MEKKFISIQKDFMKDVNYEIKFDVSDHAIVDCDCGYFDCTGKKIIQMNGEKTKTK